MTNRDDEKASVKWLVDNDWDYQKYGDKRGDRSAYDGLMNYEITDVAYGAFLDGCTHIRNSAEWKAMENQRDDLKARLAVAVEALNYYGAQSPTDLASDCDFADSCGFTVFKQGKRAREALKAINGTK